MVGQAIFSYRTTPKSQLDYVKEAAKENLDNAKKEYSAVKLAKTKGRPTPYYY